MKRKVALLIRVYNRIEDLKFNLQIIKDTWLEFDYYIIVVSNGYADGYIIDDDSIHYIDTFITLNNNVGHKKGNAQLLIEGYKSIPLDCDYTIILEADTWMYTDALILKYIIQLDESPNLVWASADWYDKDYSLAVDFAIIKSDFIRKNDKLFDFEQYPESYIANYLKNNNVQFTWIYENMPIHVPSYITKYPYIDDFKNKRFYVFPKSKMVTHHIEYLKDEMLEKKRYFNIVANCDYFKDEIVWNKKWKKFKICFWIGLSSFFIKKSWFKKKYYRNIS